MSNQNNDPVNHPAHYETNGIECFDAIVASQGVEAAKNFCVCNAAKYIWRHRRKNGVEDIEKAVWYLKKYLELVDKDDEEAKSDEPSLGDTVINYIYGRNRDGSLVSVSQIIKSLERKLEFFKKIEKDGDPDYDSPEAYIDRILHEIDYENPYSQE